MSNKGLLQISFAWLFAIIAGAIIIIIAVFAVSKIVHVGQYESGAETQKQIGVLLNPLETGFQSGEVTSLLLPVKSRIYNRCDNLSGIFGKQTIRLSQQSLGKWSIPPNGVSFNNKYIFSNNVTEGKQFLLFSKPFNFPFKISDLIYLTSASDKYCFVNTPPDIYEELSNLNQKNILLKNTVEECPEKSINVCFSNENCDINVDYNLGIVSKNNTEVDFNTDALMYGAIFASKNIYECQLKRLMERETQLANLYLDKSNLIAREGCDSGLNPDLLQLSSFSNTFSDSNSLNNMMVLVNQIEQENEIAKCRLW